MNGNNLVIFIRFNKRIRKWRKYLKIKKQILISFNTTDEKILLMRIDAWKVMI